MHKITFTLLVIGCLNWGVFAITGWEVGQIFGGMEEVVSKIIYILVGLSAVWEVIMHKKNCRRCTEGSKMATTSGT